MVELSPHLLPGDVLNQGELLVAVDPVDYRLALTASEAQLAAAELHHAQQVAEAEIAAAEAETGPSPESTALSLRLPHLSEAEARLAAARAAVEKARLDLERTRIHSPMAARVRSRSVEVGQFVSVGQPLVTLQSVDFAEIRLPIPRQELPDASDLARFRALIHIEESGGPPLWQGVLHRLEPDVDPRSGMSHAVVRVADPYALAGRPGPALQPGTLVYARLISGREQRGFWIPRTALTRQGELLVAGADGSLTSRRVEVALSLDDWIVVEQGLEPGEGVCLKPPELFVEGLRPQIVPVTLDELDLPENIAPIPGDAPPEAGPGHDTDSVFGSEPSGSIPLTPEPDVEHHNIELPPLTWQLEPLPSGFLLHLDAVPETTRSFSMDSPDRWVIDLQPALWPHAEQNVELPAPFLGMRLAQFQVDPTPVVRIVIDLPAPLTAAPSIETLDTGLQIRFTTPESIPQEHAPLEDDRDSEP